MQLDKTKKYEFCGEVCEWHESVKDWSSLSWYWSGEDFQLFADHGHVKEVREPLVFEGEVTFDKSGGIENADGVACWWTAIHCNDRKGKTFKVTWTEVVK